MAGGMLMEGPSTPYRTQESNEEIKAALSESQEATEVMAQQLRAALAAAAAVNEELEEEREAAVAAAREAFERGQQAAQAQLDAQLDAQKQQAQLAESDARNVSRWLASADDDPDDALHASAHHSAIPVP